MKIGIIGAGDQVKKTLIEALVKGVEEKTGEKVEIVSIHPEDEKALLQQIPQEIKDPTICPNCGKRHPLVAEFGYCGNFASKIYGDDPF